MTRGLNPIGSHDPSLRTGCWLGLGPGAWGRVLRGPEGPGWGLSKAPKAPPHSTTDGIPLLVAEGKMFTFTKQLP